MNRLEHETNKSIIGAHEPAEKVLIIACGALANEILAIIEQNKLSHITLTCIAANLHNEPEKIPDAVRGAIHKHRADYDRIVVGFGDCGTGGLLDKVLQEEKVERIDGAHCYAFYSGLEAFDQLEEDNLGSFYLTDFLARQFDSMVIKPLGLDRFPELRDTYFGNYNRVVYLAQTKNSELEAKALDAANRLRLPLVTKYVGFGELEQFVTKN